MSNSRASAPRRQQCSEIPARQYGKPRIVSLSFSTGLQRSLKDHVRRAFEFEIAFPLPFHEADTSAPSGSGDLRMCHPAGTRAVLDRSSTTNRRKKTVPGGEHDQPATLNNAFARLFCKSLLLTHVRPTTSPIEKQIRPVSETLGVRLLVKPSQVLIPSGPSPSLIVENNRVHERSRSRD